MKQWYKQYFARILIGFIGWLFLLTVPPLLLAEAESAQEVSLAELKSGKVILSWDEMKKLLKEIETLKQAIETLKQEQAQTLRQAQIQKEQNQKGQKQPIPVEYSITKSRFIGEVNGLSAQFQATFSMQILTDKWIKIPFFQNDVGIEAISINMPDTVEPKENEQNAQFVRDTKGYYLLAKGPQSLAIQATFRVPLLVKELTHTLSFIPPRAVINHITLKIPEKEINIVQKNAHSQVIQQDEITMIETLLSERDILQLAWKVEEKDSGSHRKSLRKSIAVLHALASIDKSDISVFNTIVLKHVASLNNIAFRLPLQVEIMDVTSLGIKQWFIEKQAESQVIKIVGDSDPRIAIKIDFSYRLRLPTLPTDIVIPPLEMIGMDTLEGFLGIEVLGNLEVNTKQVTNGILIPAKNLPQILWQKASNPLLYGYQFYRNTFTPSFSIKGYQDIKTVVANVDMVDCVTHRTLEGKSITRILYFIRNNDRQFLTLTLPEKSHIWQAFLNGKPVKPAQKDTGEILIPMKKSSSQGGDLRSFSIEIGYITEVSKLSLKGDILNQLPAIDIPISYLRWSLYLPEYYEYSKFEGLLKQVSRFSQQVPQNRGKFQMNTSTQPQIDIPTQGRRFLFEKYLIVEERPYIRGKYGQFLGNDLFLSLHPSGSSGSSYRKTLSHKIKIPKPILEAPKADMAEAKEPATKMDKTASEYDDLSQPPPQIAPNQY